MAELRLYYDDNGNYICYTCEHLEGNYIVIDSQTFAEGRTDVRVIDGKVVRPSSIIIKLDTSNTGIKCAVEDVCIIVDEDYNGQTLMWEEKIYEPEHR